MKFQGASFSKELNKEFATTLRKRVREHFKENELSVTGNTAMVLKSIFMVALYLVPFGLMFSGLFTSPFIFLAMWILMGFGMSGIGLSIMHDANHGAFSKNKAVNKFMGNLVSLAGGCATTWKIQHNVLHHSYTNIDGMDEDIKSLSLLRFSPHQERRKVHRFQFMYAWFFYSLMTILWITAKDFTALNRYHKMGLLKSQNRTYAGLFTEILLSKVIYYIVFLILPLMFLPVATWVTVVGFLAMHMICGLILGAIFQPAHVVPDTEYPMPDKDLKIDENWLIHQLHTTTNFAPDSKLFSWFVGGLNHQVEHHLFPNVCHVHYKDISKIVKKTAEEYGFPYYSQPTFIKAVKEHTRMLYLLGRKDLA